MFGLFFLVLVPMVIFRYFWFVFKITSNAPILGKVAILLIFIGLPLSYPFLYKLSSTYREFNALCSSSERTKIFKSIPVNIFNASYFNDGYNALLEKPYSAFFYKSKKYSPIENFKTEQCKKYCEYSFSTECAENKCLIESALSESDSYLDYKSHYESKDSPGSFNSLLRTSISQLVSNEHGVLAESYDYTFYLYGTGWATILGAASGSAPSIRCENFSHFNYYEITPPK